MSPDWSASNPANRWMLVLSRQFTQSFSPQLLVFGADQHSPQVGINLTHLLNDATVIYLEWSGGRGRTLESQVAGEAGQSAFRSQLATGLTYTAPFRLSVTLEYEQNDAAPDGSQWNELRNGAVTEFARYLSYSGRQQELATRHALFTYVSWKDLFVHNLDVAAFSRTALEDHSRVSWLEARYHWQQLDVAIQWQASSGASRTVFGASAESRRWQVLFACYFP